jgi:hypothetical protein
VIQAINEVHKPLLSQKHSPYYWHDPRAYGSETWMIRKADRKR